MPEHKNLEIDPELARRLEVLRAQPPRDTEKAARGRAVFLAQAQEMAVSLTIPVSRTEKARHNSWMHPLHTFFKTQRKERFPMFGALGSILLIVSIILGGSGVTLAAAQNSLPDQALYPV